MYQKLYFWTGSKKILRILVIVALMLAVLASPVAAEEKPAESAWEFQVVP
jgi:hypothetical protein